MRWLDSLRLNKGPKTHEIALGTANLGITPRDGDLPMAKELWKAWQLAQAEG